MNTKGGEIVFKWCSNNTNRGQARREGQECGFFTGVKNFDQNFEHNNSGEVNTGRYGRGKWSRSD